MIEIHTPRLTIATLTLQDAQTVADRVTQKVSCWTSPIPWPYELRHAEEWIAQSSAEKCLGVYLGDALIGTTSIPAEDGDEIGFWIHEDYEGNGYATEVASAVIQYAFSQKALRFIDSSVHRDNGASQRVHQKLGFKVTGQAERYWPNKNALVPITLYRLAAGDWRRRN